MDYRRLTTQDQAHLGLPLNGPGRFLALYTLIPGCTPPEIRRFLVPKTSIENVNAVQPEAKVEETQPNVENEFNPNEIVRDPGCRKQIHMYASDIQNQVRRPYILKGPTQPDLAIFPRTQFGKYSRAFCKAWYKNYRWIEYSEPKNATYCFYIFLFKSSERAEHFGYEVFNKD
ncbi:uncharacterized protein LOC131659186 [Vicia villosa]|uniref:uncharacterized protein LOC131659186 n=1 Tax=Vicia villosa TaxID=3911 RepID=UPI00273B13E0|nr:uncharacterized protein LOC131659186 [Vicia villosa]